MNRVFKLHIEHQKSQLEAGERLTEGESITVQEAADSMGEKLRELVQKEKEQKRRAKEKRSCEIDRLAMKKTIERQQEEDTENSSGDNIPSSSEYVEQIIAPSKTGTTILTNAQMTIEIKEPVAVVQKLTPRKQLRAAPNLSDSNSQTSRRGLDWDDQMRLELLQYWVEYSDVPFYAYIKGSAERKKMAREVIELLKRYFCKNLEQ